MEVDNAKAFNVRKNRERGRIDILKFGKILDEENKKGLSCRDLAKKYGYSSHTVIVEIIEIFRRKDEILKRVDESTKRLSIGKGRKVLRELKREERGELQTPIPQELEDGVRLLTIPAHISLYACEGSLQTSHA